MRYKKLSSVMGVIALTCGLSGGAYSACSIGEETNAASVQADSGNGNYDCTLFTTSDGTLGEVYYYPDRQNPGYHVTIEGGSVTWSADTDPDDPEGRPYDVDLVSVARSSGKRCNYTYPDQPVGGTGLTTSDGGAPLYVTICADGITQALPPPPPPEPISTALNGCSALFDSTGDGEPDAEFEVAFGYTKQFFDDGVEGAAVCTKGGEGQRECVNECKPREPTETACAPAENGEVPLGCAQCEWEYQDPAGSEKDLKYCWYWENRVSEENDTFIPSPKKKSLHAQIDVTTGSDCYTVTVGPLYGGYTYSYQYCPPPPAP